MALRHKPASSLFLEKIFSHLPLDEAWFRISYRRLSAFIGG